jgi:putative oxygen-independent coproporphyrinogen III oxidase
MSEGWGIYLQVPFCPTLCPYCDFPVVLRTPGMVEAYLKRLAEEARALYAAFPIHPQSLYLGGGTPSFLKERELEALFSALPWPLAGAEVSLEANPGTLNRARLALLRDLGVNRISLGIQSFQEAVLRRLGRAHRRRGAFRAVELVQDSGLRWSLDLILGLPEQDPWADLREALAVGAPHLSVYSLQIEPGTPFALEEYQPDEIPFEAVEKLLAEGGLERYEVSNFARPGEACRHNLLYWRGGFWLGLGPKAVAQLPGHPRRRETRPPLPRWLQGEPPEVEELDEEEFLKERIMLGLRLKEGLELGALVELPELLKAIEELQEDGLLFLRGTRLQPTSRGLNFLHPVILKLWQALERAGQGPSGG